MAIRAGDDLPRDLNITSYFLDRNLTEGRGERTALITPGGRVTYAQLAALTNRVGNVLRGLGVGQEERVLLALSDGVEFVASWFACQKIGAVTAEVYTFLHPKDYAYYLDYTRARVVVVDVATVGRIRDAVSTSRHRPWLLVVGAGRETSLREQEVSFDELVAAAPEDLAAAPTTRDDIAIWKFTTGSTGRPKACVHVVESPVLNYLGYARGVLDLSDADLVLPVPKLFFGYARDLAALYPLAVGGAGLVFPGRSTPELIFELIAEHRPTILVNVPTMMQAMLDHPDAAHQDLGCLRLCTSAGEALPEALHRRFTETFGVEVVEGIGSSEAYHIYISNRPGRVRPGSLGEVVPGYGARVVDEDGHDLTDGQVGRLWIRGTAALMYWRDRAASVRTFAGDTVMSGDLVERDPGGCFQYRGRADDLLKVGGMWVAPNEIETCLIDHPDVVHCAVVGVEHEGLTLSCAYVVLRPQASLDADAVRDFVRARLAPHKVPREVRFVTELPTTGSGKVDRSALRALAAAETVPA